MLSIEQDLAVTTLFDLSFLVKQQPTERRTSCSLIVHHGHHLVSKLDHISRSLSSEHLLAQLPRGALRFGRRHFFLALKKARIGGSNLTTPTKDPIETSASSDAVSGNWTNLVHQNTASFCWTRCTSRSHEHQEAQSPVLNFWMTMSSKGGEC